MNELEKEIELYLDGSMSSEQRLVFEEKMSKNPQLQKDVVTYTEMYTIYNENDWNLQNTTKNQQITDYESFLMSEQGNAVAKSIKNAEEMYFETQSSSKTRQWLVYIGSIAAIFIIGFFIATRLNTGIDHNALYADYKNWENLPSLTVRDTNTILAEGEQLFREQQYEEALALFTKFNANDTTKLNTQVLIYMGVTQLELSAYNDALQTFEELKNTNTLDAPKANWFIALTYLKMNSTQKAKDVLKIITNDSNNYNYKKAKSLLRALE
ncbi:tetratricopeptide repeat protein [Aquimarina algicola]|uniref:Uncharacterized protein n=1 Tax=Aquimarina algicola TaxID=2589995 RepID=A0A504JAK5_9FLAO|nr:hypothetical protein [Aquimarina algicola]TPN87694.1 hypothetical protein FHK87_08950 [Aquimarina algicola]